MAKARTSVKRKKSTSKQSQLKIRANVGVIEYDPLKEILNEEFIDAAILECLKNNDPAGAMEVLEIYINALKSVKSDLFEEVNLPKTTAYRSFRSKNPTLRTFSRLMHAAHIER
jgi:DNA-binding phage protein